MSQDSDPADPVRRRILKALGAAGVPIAAAGCSGDGGDGGDSTDTGDGAGTDTGDGGDGGAGANTLRVALSENVNSFDPPYSSGVPSSIAHNFFYEALTTTDRRGNIYPWLAESYELAETNETEAADYADYMTTAPYAEDEEGNVFIDTDEQIVVRHPDNPAAPEAGDEAQILTVNEASDAVEDGTFGMQYQFSLHEGVEFHNGEELTAENVVRSYERYENSQVSAQVWQNFLYAEQVDDYTVNLYSQVPSAEALRNIVWSVFPTDHIDLPDGELDPREGTTPVGTGPYEFSEFEDAEYFVVTKYDDYWMEDYGIQNKDWFEGPDDFPSSPAVEEVDMDILPEDSSRSAALQEDEVDMTYGLTADAQTEFDESENYGTASIETGGYLFFQYSVNVEPWDQEEVRRAANHLIPRTQIVDNIEQGWAREAWTPVPDIAEGAGTTDPEALEEDLKPMNEYDPDRAEELINEAGVETPIETTIETNSDNTDRVRKAELIQEAMNNSGLFDVELETYEFGDFLGRIFGPDYPETNNILLIGLSGTFDPGSFCEATHHSRNIGQCCNSQGIAFDDLDQMMDEAKFGTEVLDDSQLRAERYDEVWRTIVERSANSYVNIDLTTAVHNNAVQNFEAYPFPEGLLSFGLYGPTEGVMATLDRE